MPVNKHIQPTWLEINLMWVVGGFDIVAIGTDVLEYFHLFT